MIFSSLLSASLAAPSISPEFTKSQMEELQKDLHSNDSDRAIYGGLPTKLVFNDVKLDVVAYCSKTYTTYKPSPEYKYAIASFKGKSGDERLEFDVGGDNSHISIAGIGKLEFSSNRYGAELTRENQFLPNIVAGFEKLGYGYWYNIETGPNKKPVTLKECNKDNSRNLDTGKWGYVTKFTAHYDRMVFTKNNPDTPDDW
jgi:hypothetical protein